jgi:hypothetical protein
MIVQIPTENFIGKYKDCGSAYAFLKLLSPSPFVWTSVYM